MIEVTHHPIRPLRQSVGRPRRSFDMRESEGSLFEQLDAEEKTVVEQAASVVRDA